jgi:hypothetical protein
MTNPDIAAKAAALVVVANSDGSWSVEGEHGRYSVRPGRNGLICSCQAGNAHNCSHRIAVHGFRAKEYGGAVNVDDLTAEELGTMSLYELGRTLNTVSVTITKLAKERQDQNIRFADLKIAQHRAKVLGDEAEVSRLQEELLLQGAIVANLQIRHGALKELKSSLQSTIRTVGAN